MLYKHNWIQVTVLLTPVLCLTPLSFRYSSGGTLPSWCATQAPIQQNFESRWNISDCSLWLGTQRSLFVCSDCAHYKSSHQPPAGLLHPLPVPSQPWSHIAVDFVTVLPPSDGNTTILTIVDCFSKSVHFLPLSKLPPGFWRCFAKPWGPPQVSLLDTIHKLIARQNGLIRTLLPFAFDWICS